MKVHGADPARPGQKRAGSAADNKAGARNPARKYARKEKPKAVIAQRPPKRYLGTVGKEYRRFSGWWKGWTSIVVVAIVSGCGGGPPPAPLTKITIDSAPEQGASVLVQGEERGVTPLTLEGLPPGWVDVLLKKDNYKRASDRVEVKEGAPLTFVIEMEPLVGYVSLESTPIGADVFLDGEMNLGKTPLFRQPLRIGEHTYEIKMADYYPVKETLTVEEDFQYEFKHPLKPMEATLTVLSRPSGASVGLNTQPQPEKTPCQFQLPPGIYLVTAYSKGFVQSESKIELKANQQESITLVMQQGEVPEGMVLIPAGEFIWGADERSPDESPRRKVFLDAYYIDKTEVTNAQFKQVFPSHTFPKAQAQYPVGGVSWSQAMDYASKSGKRLPTEAEWEKAARGEDGREYPWGGEFAPDMCNTQESKLDGPARVGSYLGGISACGCLDMAGNMYEWTVDWYDRYPGNTVIATDYGQIFRVMRGGSYMTTKFDARCARRHFDRMDARRADYGFRCVKDVASK